MDTETVEFKMPSVSVGDIVLFWDRGVRLGAPMPAVVIKVNPSSVLLRCLGTLKSRDGVRHADDPMLKVGEQDANGSWDFADRGQKKTQPSPQNRPVVSAVKA